MLELQKLTKHFGHHLPALNKVSLRLNKGEFCIVIGANGSGKSTLLKTISGEVLPSEGKLYLDKIELTQMSVHQRASLISSVIQDPNKGTIGEMSLLENLSLSTQRTKKAGYSLYIKEKSLLKERLASLKLGLEQYLDKPMNMLSGGQKQLIATLMATLNKPALLLLDEHCSALDPKTHQQIMTYTHETIRQSNISTLMITHHLPDALKYGQRLIMLHKGRVVLDLKEEQKKALSLPTLLKYFHSYDHHIESACEQGETIC